MRRFSELIKNFDNLKAYMRRFYIYGFQTRSRFGQKSLRSYDNERRRIESYLGSVMRFRQDHTGKQVFLSLDSRCTPHNPFYRAFRAKSFTKNDITLHFYLLDLLQPGVSLTLGELAQRLEKDYLCHFSPPLILDLSTIRKKLNEYCSLGLLRKTGRGCELRYCRAVSAIALDGAEPALSFFSEAAPAGVIGSYLLDRFPKQESLFAFKHHYLMHALDSEILLHLLDLIHRKQTASITSLNAAGNTVVVTALPMQIMTSIQTGRMYLAAFVSLQNRFVSLRLDFITSVNACGHCTQFDARRREYEAYRAHAWGVSFSSRLEHLEMRLRIAPGEDYLLRRIHREGRHGTLCQTAADEYLFSIDAWDCMELLPWLRTFTGRILSLDCSNEAVTRTFRRDLEAMKRYYGGVPHALS